MSGYIEAGYLVALGSLGAYAASLVGRERAARRRLHRTEGPAGSEAGAESPSGEGRESR